VRNKNTGVGLTGCYCLEQKKGDLQATDLCLCQISG